jgi:hypothetical protein
MIDNEEFPYQSADPDLQPVPAPISPAQKELDEQEYQNLKMLVRLLVGTAAEGTDEFSRRAALWQAEMNRLDASPVEIPYGEETELTRLRYTLIGFLFGAIDAGTSGLSLFDQVTSKAITTVSKIFSPLTRSRAWQPVQNKFDASKERGESIINLWMEKGRNEEQASRYLVRKQAYEEIINDAIDYLAAKPEIGDLVQQQSVSVVGEVVDDVRFRSSEFDTLLESKVRSLLRKKPLQ